MQIWVQCKSLSLINSTSSSTWLQDESVNLIHSTSNANLDPGCNYKFKYVLMMQDLVKKVYL